MLGRQRRGDLQGALVSQPNKTSNFQIPKKDLVQKSKVDDIGHCSLGATCTHPTCTYTNTHSCISTHNTEEDIMYKIMNTYDLGGKRQAGKGERGSKPYNSGEQNVRAICGSPPRGTNNLSA